MDWRAITFDWNRARAFLVTVEEGSLSAAARALGMAQPTLGRQVSALEEELGVSLFERGGRGLILTPAGLELVDHVRAMGQAAGRFSLAATGRAERIEGSIAITASEIYSAHLLPPIIAGLRRAHPGITVEVVASDTLSDLHRREADIAIRNTRPTQPDLIGRMLCEDHGAFFATPDYIARSGPFETPADLARAELVGLARNHMLIEGLNARGIPVTADNFPVQTGSHLVHWNMVCAGLGVGIVPDWLGDAEPRVARALPGSPPIAYPVWLIAHREVNTSRRVRLVFDLLAAEIIARLSGIATGAALG
ncbi:LysR family transcriptional regulator [Oceanibium sediminis]|uniref:LysR family transcriptional regulator n=1 Tax=Oceanibium sediminis TaxID=2026339 RepID=UPI000DD329AB|nr:LysR family transcriptional regulator [Oceanibium sediminis]